MLMETRLTEQTTAANLEAVRLALPDAELLLEAQELQLEEHLAASRAFKVSVRKNRNAHAVSGLLTRDTSKKMVTPIALAQALAACE